MLDERDRKLIDKLPPDARARFVKLHAEHDGLSAAAREQSGRRTELRESIRNEQDSLNRLLAQPPISRPREDDAIVLLARESIARKQRDLHDLDAADHFLGDKRQTLDQLVTRTIALVASMPGDQRLQMLKRPAAALRKGESYHDAVGRCRSKVAQLRADLAEIETAPLPAALAKANATREVEQLAERGRPNVVGMVEHGGRLEWAEKFSHVRGGEGSLEVDDTLAVMAWLFRDAMIAAVHKGIDAAADDEHALAPAERATAAAKIAAQIDDAERDETSYIEQGERAGISIAHRADISICALLGLSEKFAAAPKVDETPRMTGQPARPRVEAPVHGSSLPQPATRDQIWR